MSNDNLLNKLRQKNRQRAAVTERKDQLFTSSSTNNELAQTSSIIDNDNQVENQDNFSSLNDVEEKDLSQIALDNAISKSGVNPPPNLNYQSEEKDKLAVNEEPNNQATLAELKKQLAQFPTTRRRSGIVLEEELDFELTTYCKKNGITVETFLEASWLIVSEKETILKKVTKQAKFRYQQRKEAGHLRRLITALEKRQ